MGIQTRRVGQGNQRQKVGQQRKSRLEAEAALTVCMEAAFSGMNSLCMSSVTR
jgi:hypothetical protein